MSGLVWAAVLAIGAAVGFLGGLFGKGGSAVATPLLHAVGVPAFVAVAAPLPATVPSTLVASWAYWRKHLVDYQVVAWSIALGAPATVAGALVSDRVGGPALVTVTDVIVAGLGLRFLLRPTGTDRLIEPVEHRLARIVAVAVIAGFAAGLLANSGGFLLAPLYLVVLRVDVKTAFACSLAVSAGLAVPGTITHALLGHIDWPVVMVFGAASIPLSYAGARVALRTESVHLERIYGAALAALGIAMVAISR
jgi:uncharacterized membrane protein YfcA